jgi:hypothetical protein
VQQDYGLRIVLRVENLPGVATCGLFGQRRASNDISRHFVRYAELKFRDGDES